MTMTPQQFINTVAPSAVAFMKQHRIPASVTIAQGALESDWGNCAPGNNCFGIKADASWHGPTVTVATKEWVKDAQDPDGHFVVVQAKFRAYPNFGASIADHGQFLLDNSRYHNLVGTDYKTACNLLHVDGYATDPGYTSELIDIIEQYQLYQYDRVTTPMPTLQLGANGAAVRTLQTALNAHGASPKLKVDGDFGPKTKDAVLTFQKARNLVQDGVVGPRTWTALGAVTLNGFTPITHSFPVTSSHVDHTAVTASTPVWQTYVPSGKPLPKRVNNRALYGPVLNQEALGSCTSFGATQWRVALRQQAGFPYERLSELAQYYEERLMDGTVNQDAGSSMHSAVAVLEQFGGMPESADPYDPNPTQRFTQAPPNAWDASLKLNPAQAFYVSGRDNVRDALARGMAVMGAYQCFAELETGAMANSGWLLMPADLANPIGGHMTLIIGYDDDLQAFLLMNQWSDQWGIKNDPTLHGCFWMPYAYFDAYMMDVVAGTPDNGIQPVPQPSPAPFVKPQVDVYDVRVAFSQKTAKVGDAVTVTVTSLKNGQPFPGQFVGFQINLDDGAPLVETGFTTDANGQFTYNYTFDKYHTCTATIHYETPNGDWIARWDECDCLAPVTYPTIETDVTEHRKSSGVVYGGATHVPPDLWQRCGTADQTDATHWTVNGKTYIGVVQNGVVYLHWAVMTNNGFGIAKLPTGGWSFTN